MSNADEFYASILTNVRKEAKAEELDRIISLLEGYKEPDMKHHKFTTLVNIDRIIALIKGENK